MPSSSYKWVGGEDEDDEEENDDADEHEEGKGRRTRRGSDARTCVIAVFYSPLSQRPKKKRNSESVSE